MLAIRTLSGKCGENVLQHQSVVVLGVFCCDEQRDNITGEMVFHEIACSSAVSQFLTVPVCKLLKTFGSVSEPGAQLR